MRHLLPKPAERLALKVAHRLRHYWRKLRKPHLLAVTVLVRDRAGRVLFIRHSYGPTLWTLPGGGISRGEAPADAARREMREELGIALGDLQLLQSFTETVSGAPQTAHVFGATIEGEPQPDGREVIAARFFPTNALPEPLSALTRRRLAVLEEPAG